MKTMESIKVAKLKSDKEISESLVNLILKFLLVPSRPSLPACLPATVHAEHLLHRYSQNDFFQLCIFNIKQLECNTI